tara:strand:- start:929 stop:1915 length:987 start_codon:yes stop_codon:yes gene_type:complete
MATYKEIHGTNIEVLSSDPANSVEGQVWYNSTSNVVKFNAGALSGAWATKSAMSIAKQAAGGVGSTNAALAFNGQPYTSPTSNATESYNGSWTSISPGNMANGRFELGSAGTQTGALGFGGYRGPPGIGRVNESESFNGSAWTTTPSLNAEKYGVRGSGLSNTAALCVGGNDEASNSSVTSTESYNGSWTNGPALNTARQQGQCSGSQTSALYSGNGPSNAPTQNATESYNGSWTNGPTNPQPRGLGAQSSVSNASAISFNGGTGGSNQATIWNGSSWTTSATSNEAHTETQGAKGGSSASTLVFGGSPGGLNTEEFSSSGGIRTLSS